MCVVCCVLFAGCGLLVGAYCVLCVLCVVCCLVFGGWWLAAVVRWLLFVGVCCLLIVD